MIKVKGDISWMSRDQISQVLSIEHYMLDTWDEERIVQSIRQRNIMALTFTQSNWVQGWIVYELKKESFIIHRLCVHPYYQRQGVGETLIRKLTGKLSFDRRREIVFAVPDDLLGLHLFLKYCGFKARVVGNEYEFRYRI